MLNLRRRQTAAAIAFAVLLQLCCCGAQGGEQIYTKLVATRDALLSQEREIQRSYDETSRKIDELSKKQAVLDSYLRQTNKAISDIDRSMAQVQ